MNAQARLVGGPLDGDEGRIGYRDEIPGALWAWLCRDCGDVHWALEWVRGAEKYTHRDSDEGGIEVYEYDGVGGGGIETHTVEREPVLA